MPLRRVGKVGAGWAAASVLVVACGAAFHTNPDDVVGGASNGDSGAGGGLNGGAPIVQGGAGGAVSGAGGATGEGGAGGVADTSGCALWGGVEWQNGHCYVDITVGTATQPAALSACAELADQSYLLVLNDQGEQDFILNTFLLQLENVSDAWLGLTCSAQTHP